MKFIIIVIGLVSKGSCSINVTYLISVLRLSGTIDDHYFNCNAKSTSLIWEVNGTRAGGFVGGSVSKVVTGTASSFNYTSTLLSSMPIDDTQYTLDSVLVVSMEESSTLNVSCLNGTFAANIISTQNRRGNVISSNISESLIQEEYVLSSKLVQDNNYNHTSIFICRVYNQFMYWGTGTTTIGFSSGDGIGASRSNLQENAVTVTMQAALIAENSSELVSVLFLTANTDTTVICGFPQNEVQLTSNCQLALPPIGPISTELSGKTNMSALVTNIPGSVDNVERTTTHVATTNSHKTSTLKVSRNIGVGVAVAVSATTVIVSVTVAIVLIKIQNPTSNKRELDDQGFGNANQLSMEACTDIKQSYSTETQCAHSA